jgi:hypothetical protein
VQDHILITAGDALRVVSARVSPPTPLRERKRKRQNKNKKNKKK